MIVGILTTCHTQYTVHQPFTSSVFYSTMTEFSDRKVIYGGYHGGRIFEVCGLAA